MVHAQLNIHEHYDIIIDMSPVTLFVETNQICKAVSGVIFMADEQMTKMRLRHGLRALRTGLKFFNLPNSA